MSMILASLSTPALKVPSSDLSGEHKCCAGFQNMQCWCFLVISSRLEQGEEEHRGILEAWPSIIDWHQDACHINQKCSAFLTDRTVSGDKNDIFLASCELRVSNTALDSCFMEGQSS